MARGKKKKINKSLAIREYRKEHPEAGPTAVAAALADQGIAVSAAYVSDIWTKDRKAVDLAGGRSGPKGPKTMTPAGPADAAPAWVATSLIHVDDLKNTKQFVKEQFQGNLARAEQAIAQLREAQLTT